MKRVIFATLAVALLGGGAVVIHWQVYLPPECRGDVPKAVEFRQGMTLCPGQSATVSIKPE
jgi:hypothetical protein